MIIPIIALIFGVLIGAYAQFYIPMQYSHYLAVAILAAMDTIFGGITSNLNKNFNLTIFITGLFGNALLAALILFIGERLGISLIIAVAVVFVLRMFQNFALIRRILLNKYLNNDKL